MRYVCERTAVHNCRSTFEGLYKIGFYRVFQKRRHRAFGFKFSRADVTAVLVYADYYIAYPLFQIGKVRCKAKNSHYFGSRRYLEAFLPLIAFTALHIARRAVQRYIAERPVVHVHTSAEINFLYFKRISAENMIVYHSAQKVVRRCNRVQIASKMQIYIRHRHNLRVTSARGSALYSEHRSE